MGRRQRQAAQGGHPGLKEKKREYKTKHRKKQQVELNNKENSRNREAKKQKSHYKRLNCMLRLSE